MKKIVLSLLIFLLLASIAHASLNDVVSSYTSATVEQPNLNDGNYGYYSQGFIISGNQTNYTVNKWAMEWGATNTGNFGLSLAAIVENTPTGQGFPNLSMTLANVSNPPTPPLGTRAYINFTMTTNATLLNNTLYHLVFRSNDTSAVYRKIYTTTNNGYIYGNMSQSSDGTTWSTAYKLYDFNFIVYDGQTTVSSGTSTVSVGALFPANDTKLNASYSSIDLNATYNSTNNINCSLYVKGVLNQTKSNLTNGTNTLINFNISFATDEVGLFNYSFYCAEASDNGINSTSVTNTFWIDRIVPTITYHSPKNDNTSIFRKNFTTLIELYDENAYSWTLNISLSNGTVIFNKTNISLTGLTRINITEFINLTAYPNTQCNSYTKFCDGHTDEIIKMTYSKKSTETLAFDDSYTMTYDDDKTKIQDFYAEKEKNKYNITLITKNPEKQVSFVINGSQYVDILDGKTKYEGHLIINNAYWWDAEEPDNEQVKVERISSTSVRVTVTTKIAKKEFKFQSTGELNCREEWRSFTTGTAIEINLTTPANKTYVNHSQNVMFNFTAYDDADTCKLWHNQTSWHANTTITGITLGTPKVFYENMSEGSITWGIWCNNTFGSSVSTNYTFTIDTTNPELVINEPNTTTKINLSNIPINYNVRDNNLNTSSCFYNITQSNGSTILSTTLLASCENASFNATAYDTSYTITIMVFDYAGNKNISSKTFSTASNMITAGTPTITKYSFFVPDSITYTINVSTNNSNITTVTLYYSTPGGDASTGLTQTDGLWQTSMSIVHAGNYNFSRIIANDANGYSSTFNFSSIVTARSQAGETQGGAGGIVSDLLVNNEFSTFTDAVSKPCFVGLTDKKCSIKVYFDGIGTAKTDKMDLMQLDKNTLLVSYDYKRTAYPFGTIEDKIVITSANETRIIPVKFYVIDVFCSFPFPIVAPMSIASSPFFSETESNGTIQIYWLWVIAAVVLIYYVFKKSKG